MSEFRNLETTVTYQNYVLEDVHSRLKPMFVYTPFGVSDLYVIYKPKGWTLENCDFVKGKGKVVPVISFNWASRHEGVLGEWRYSPTHSSTSALHEGEWTALLPGRFTPRERAPGTHWIGDWVVPVPVWTRWWREKFPTPVGSRTLEPRSSSA
jgi:hypothetical protein